MLGPPWPLQPPTYGSRLVAKTPGLGPGHRGFESLLLYPRSCQVRGMANPPRSQRGDSEFNPRTWHSALDGRWQLTLTINMKTRLAQATIHIDFWQRTFVPHFHCRHRYDFERELSVCVWRTWIRLTLLTFFHLKH